MRGSTLSQAPTDAKPKNSKQASVMNPAVRSTMPVASRITQSSEAVRKRRPKPGMPRLHATMPRSESPRPAAAMSCMTGLTGIGMRPTTVRCIPAEITETRNPRAVRRLILVGSTVTASTP
jgi:hypothetical protein